SRRGRLGRRAARVRPPQLPGRRHAHRERLPRREAGRPEADAEVIPWPGPCRARPPTTSGCHGRLFPPCPPARTPARADKPPVAPLGRPRPAGPVACPDVSPVPLLLQRDRGVASGAPLA